MPVQTESNSLGDWLKFEEDNLYSRDEVTVASGQNLATGTVIGVITTSGKVTQLAPAASDGSETAAGVLLHPVDASTADQPGVMQTVEAVRIFKQISDPPVKTIVGLSNVSNGSPNEVRGLINRVMLVMCLGAGLDAAIVDPLDSELLEWVRIVETRDESTPKGKLLCAIYDAVANMEDLDPSVVDMKDREQVEIFKTWQILANKIIYAHSYLKV